MPGTAGPLASIHLGIARAARDFAIEYTKPRTRLPFKHPESYYPGHQFLAAEMDIGLKAAWAFQMDIATRLTDPQVRDDQTIVDAIAMQYFCTRTAVDVVNKAVEMLGGAALAKRLPLERYYRDVRAGPVFPISSYDAPGGDRQARLRHPAGQRATLGVTCTAKLWGDHLTIPDA